MDDFMSLYVAVPRQVNIHHKMVEIHHIKLNASRLQSVIRGENWWNNH